LKETSKDQKIWEELQQQRDSKGLKVNECVIQNATFITADPGHKRWMNHADPRRNKDSTWTKKGGKSHFG